MNHHKKGVRPNMGRKYPTCPRCIKGGYTQDFDTYDKRPKFTCTRCGHTWTCGKDGGEYTK